MGNEVEARTQRVRDHLQRPDHSDWQLTNARIRSTVYLTAPPGAVTVDCGGAAGAAVAQMDLATGLGYALNANVLTRVMRHG